MRSLALTILLSLSTFSFNLGGAAGQPPGGTPARARATLYLDVHSAGQVEVNFHLSPPPASGVTLFQKALKESLECNAMNLSTIDSGESSWHMNALCLGAIPRHGLMARGTWNFSPLLREIRASGVEVLVLNLSFHEVNVPFASEGASKYEAKSRDSSFHQFHIPTSTSSPPILRLQLGYSPRHLARVFPPLLVLLVFPVALTLYMRRAVLRKPDAVTSGAWFGYWRFLNWNTLAFFLLWITAVSVLDLHPFLEFLLSANPNGAILEPVCSNGFYFLPPILINVLCRVLSHHVFIEVQGAEWTRREVFELAVWSELALLVPIAMVFTGISLLGRSRFVWGAFALLMAFLVRVLSAQRLRKVMSSELHALTAGELRDRAFALAEKAKVKLQQVYVMPTRKARMANAFARRGNNLLLTDYLLEHLSKREVDGVLAHEFAHLRGKRPHVSLVALCITLVIAGFIAANLGSIVRWIPVGALIPMALLILILASYVTSRQVERHADAAVVPLTGDPEGYIRALAKLTALNRMPIQWGKLQGKLLSHPSTLQRAQTLARQAGISDDRLNQILNSPEEPLDHYPVPPTSASEGKVFSTTFKANLAIKIGWLTLAASTLTPALVAFIATRVRLSVPLWCVLVLGLLATFLLTAWISNVGSVWGGHTLKKRILERMKSQGLAPDAWGGIFVGFSPHPFPRVYDGNCMWDVGFLIPAGDRVCFWGEETRFALRRHQISQIRLRPGHASWWPSHRLYITWKDEEKGTGGTFNLVPADSSSLGKMYAETAALAERLQGWHCGTSFPSGIPAALETLASPALGEVTCVSPRLFGSAGVHVMGSIYVALAALLVAMLFGLFEAAGGWGVSYTMGVAILNTIATNLPCTRYRDRPA